ncbi:DUF362 domain-containing protein [Acetomicrobium sp.]|uniref:DUF362 domain-containing protein n=1 Tax=Acetomicrobium sp. TaxID=1872099 RepID=UPI001BCA7ABB
MTKKYKVAVRRASSYELDEVCEALNFTLDAIEEWIPSRFLFEKLLLKVNLLAPKKPALAVTTHPSIIQALIKIARKKGHLGEIVVADSPGHLYADRKEELLRLTGMTGAVEIDDNAIATILSDGGFVVLRRDENVVLKELTVSKRYFEAPFVINVAKLKTHAETDITACVKNCFGIADTSTRKRAHFSLSINQLCNAIVDLYLARPPELNVLDAIYAMEGNGPTHGHPRFVGLIMASKNALALDFVAAKVMGYKNPLNIPLLNIAAKRGIGPSSVDEIEIIGVEPDEIEAKGYVKSSSSLRFLPTWLRGWTHRWVALSPRLWEEKCVKCGICADVCPRKAIRMDPLPRINRAMCVKCLCCHEMCPTGAMEVHENMLMKLLRM